MCCHASKPPVSPTGPASGPGGSDGGTCADGSSPPCPCNATITIGRVIRGNPYVPRNASTADGMPDSVPPSKPYELEVTVANWTGECAGKHFDLSVANTSSDNGTATVSPAQVSGNGTFKVTVTGGDQTKPGHGGQLKIQAKLDGAVKAESAGFTVCAHPTDFSTIYDSDIPGGVRVENRWKSDSGTFLDLSEAERSEQVNIDHLDSPPFVPLSSAPLITSRYISGTAGPVFDQHTEPRPAAGPAGKVEESQLFLFKCHRCAAVDKPAPNSGFKIVHEVRRSGTHWIYTVRKFGSAATIGSNSVAAGSGSAARATPDTLP